MKLGPVSLLLSSMIDSGFEGLMLSIGLQKVTRLISEMTKYCKTIRFGL